MAPRFKEGGCMLGVIRQHWCKQDKVHTYVLGTDCSVHFDLLRGLCSFPPFWITFAISSWTHLCNFGADSHNTTLSLAPFGQCCVKQFADWADDPVSKWPQEHFFHPVATLKPDSPTVLFLVLERWGFTLRRRLTKQEISGPLSGYNMLGVS